MSVDASVRGADRATPNGMQGEVKLAPVGAGALCLAGAGFTHDTPSVVLCILGVALASAAVLQFMIAWMSPSPWAGARHRRRRTTRLAAPLTHVPRERTCTRLRIPVARDGRFRGT
jgi:hypothetical protein